MPAIPTARRARPRSRRACRLCSAGLPSASIRASSSSPATPPRPSRSIPCARRSTCRSSAPSRRSSRRPRCRRPASIGVLGTDATVRQPYVDRLAAEFAADCTVVRHGSAELVDLAEAKLARRRRSTIEAVTRRRSTAVLAQPGGDADRHDRPRLHPFPAGRGRACAPPSRAARLRRRRRRDRPAHRLARRASSRGPTRRAKAWRSSPAAPRPRSARRLRPLRARRDRDALLSYCESFALAFRASSELMAAERGTALGL